jgi:HJR/Mrr/RecB family endonuclease
MASRSRRSYRTKYTRNTHEHIIFVLVILLAAAVYVHHIKSPVSKQHILNIGVVVIALFIIALLIMLLRKLTFTSHARRLRHLQLDAMSGLEFERYIADLLPSQGYKHVRLTSYFDFGCDIVAEKDGVRWGIQVKRHSVPIGKAAVQAAVAGLKSYNCDRAMVITNSSFTSRARGLAASNNCLLVNGRQLTNWAESR